MQQLTIDWALLGPCESRQEGRFGSTCSGISFDNHVAGTIALSGSLADSLQALHNARIPREWLAHSWEASSLGTWFSGLLQRQDQLARWLYAGRPKAYWLTGFFNPQASPFRSF
jgi:hypothetical protein